MINIYITYSDMQVLKLCSTYSGCTVGDILGNKRNKIKGLNIITPRHLACYIFKNVFGYSLEYTGNILNKHHTTVINGIKSLKTDMEMDYIDNEKIKRIIDKSYELL